MELSRKTTKMVEIVKKYDSALRKGGDWKHYFAPDIPDKVMSRLLNKFDSNVAINSLVSFYDSTLFGTSKTGILFTNDGMYYKDFGKALYFAYKDISNFKIRSGHLDFDVQNSNMSEYTIIDIFDMEILKNLLLELKEIDEYYGQSSIKSSGEIKKIDLPPDMLKKCNEVIHTASVACGGAGTGLAQLPGSDNVVIVPIQIGMIVALGAIFELNITESGAKSIIASAGATIAGRTVSQFLVGWMPGIGNIVNTATAASITETIGWIAVKNFYDRWIQDRNKGRLEGMKAGYTEASNEYERKLREQANEFLSQKKDFEKERDEYEKLLEQYKDYIKELERKCASFEYIADIKGIYNDLKNLRSV